MLANSFAGTSSTVIQFEHSLRTNFSHSFSKSRRRGDLTTKFTPSAIPSSSKPMYFAGTECNEGKSSLHAKDEGAHDISSSIATPRDPLLSSEPLLLNCLDTRTQQSRDSRFRASGAADGNSKLRTTNTTNLPKLANVLERARERSQVNHDPNTSTKSAIVGRSITMPSKSKSSPTRASAAESPPQVLSSDIVAMDIESDAAFSTLLCGRRKPRTMSLGSAPPFSMHSAPSLGSSSSSSAESSPLCITPDLPPVSLPVISQSLPTDGISDAVVPERHLKPTRALSRTQSAGAPITRMTLDHTTPAIDNKVTNASAASSSSSSRSTAASPLETNASPHPPSYLSRTQRRLARAVTNPSCHDIQHYLYQGGKTAKKRREQGNKVEGGRSLIRYL
ncbi:hypothetical protein BT96DRAFT_535723 [Gymnopus androsaceus JB14]|uniref:Uncharacterized protein n=1 Tax=Gymnopus androsaceus JB14 TaxID=1447944 RepID=A0A6A4HXZ6_9AGAR|nr:hypothetical protein BT96DRAFT_535723 [Gymnopus androsaceus JB14]